MTKYIVKYQETCPTEEMEIEAATPTDAVRVAQHDLEALYQNSDTYPTVVEIINAETEEIVWDGRENS